MTLCSLFAKRLRALTDEQLVEAAAPWLAERFEALFDTQSAPPQELAEAPVPSRKPRAAKPAKPAPKAKRAEAATEPRARRAGPSEANVEAVFKTLAAADEPLAPREIVRRTKLPSNKVRWALAALRAQGRASLEGRAAGARWSIAA